MLKKGLKTTLTAPVPGRGRIKDQKAVLQVVWRGCGIAILGDIKKPAQHGPRQQGLGPPAWAGGSHQMTFRGPFPPQPCCDSP